MEPTNMHSNNRFQNGVLSGALQRFQNLLKALGLRNSVQPANSGPVATDSGHLHARPGDLHTEHADSDSKLRGGVRWLDYADPSFNLPEPVRKSRMGVVDDQPKHMRQVGNEPNQPNESSQPAQPCQPGQPGCHTCTRHPERTCNCAGDECADDGDEWVKPFTKRATEYFDRIDLERNAKYVGHQFPILRVPEHGNFCCPVNGKACGAESCGGGTCQESRSRAAAGTDWRYATPTYNSGNT
jgi:hypothetical protein